MSDTPLIDNIRNSGFEVTLDGDDFIVAPDDKLTNKHREFIQANREEIMHELLSTTVFTLWGVPIQIQARNATHQAWLIESNHKSTTPAQLTQEFTHE